MTSGIGVKTVNLLTSTLFLCSTGFASADTLRLVGEDSVLSSGTFVKMYNKQISFIDQDGVLIEQDLNAVQDIHIDKPLFINMANGETLFGSVIGANGILTITSENFDKNNLIIALNKVVSIDRSKIASATAVGQQKEKSDNIGRHGKEDYLPEEIFLRNQSGLALGTSEIETNLTFANIDKSAPLLGPEKRRTADLTLTWRYGFGPGNLSLSVPYGMRADETQNDSDKRTKTSTSTAWGNITAGGAWQFNSEEYGGLPSVSISLVGDMPTSSDPYSALWRLTPGVSFQKNTDPALLFAGFSYSYVFEKQIDRPLEFESKVDMVDYSPGNQFNFFLGSALALNEQLAMNLKVQGSYVNRMRLADQEVGDTKIPLSVVVGVAYAINRANSVEISTIFPISKDSDETAISLSYIRKFDSFL